MLNDIRYAFRTLRQNPGFALTAILSIGLAIGANSAIFSLNDAVLLRPLPVAEASQLVTLRPVEPTVSSTEVNFSSGMSYPDFTDFRDKNQSFRGLLAYQLVPAGFARDAKTQPQLRLGFLVTGNFFQVARRTREIGIRMALGAERLQVMTMILRQAATTAVAGVSIGVVLSLVSGRALTMGQPRPSFDPALSVLVPLGLLLTTLLAAAIPARRAARIDPQEALRQD